MGQTNLIVNHGHNTDIITGKEIKKICETFNISSDIFYPKGIKLDTGGIAMIKHVLANGQAVKDITGHVVSINDKTIKAYEVIVKKGAKAK